jgi:nucleoid-associated protein YgaU
MFVKFLSLVLLAVVAFAVVAHGSPGGGHEQVYRVRPGDTLWAIAAARYSGDPREAIWKIERRNHLAGAAIRVGERLVLP